MAEPKYTVPEGLELTAEQKAYYEQFGRIPKPRPTIKTNKQNFDSADWSMKKNEKADENTNTNPTQPTQPVVKQNPRLGALGGGGGGGGGGAQQKKPMVIKTNVTTGK